MQPVQEANAAAARVALNISTEEQEAMEYNGADWRDIIRQRKREIDARREMAPEEELPKAGTTTRQEEGREAKT